MYGILKMIDEYSGFQMSGKNLHLIFVVKPVYFFKRPAKLTYFL